MKWLSGNHSFKGLRNLRSKDGLWDTSDIWAPCRRNEERAPTQLSMYTGAHTAQLTQPQSQKTKLLHRGWLHGVPRDLPGSFPELETPLPMPRGRGDGPSRAFLRNKIKVLQTVSLDLSFLVLISV